MAVYREDLIIYDDCKYCDDFRIYPIFENQVEWFDKLEVAQFFPKLSFFFISTLLCVELGRTGEQFQSK